MIAVADSYRVNSKSTLLFQGLSMVGMVTLAAGLYVAPLRTWLNLLLVSNYLIGLGLGGLLLVALHYVTGARWSLAVRRVPEAMAAVLTLGAIGILAVLLGQPSIYPWTDATSQHTSGSSLQQLWLNRPFFIIRSCVYLALWLAFAAAIVRNSRRQDTENNPAPTVRNIRLSAAFLVVFGITCWLASYDWIMSLEPRWASTVFGVYQFAGIFASGIAAVILFVIWLRQLSPMKSVLNESHLHDLGILLFSFTSFWMYIWLCQYLLIWYVNNPEETEYYRKRIHGDWLVLFIVNIVLNWGIPFVVLLFRSAKRSPFVIGTVACVVLVGRWLDLYLMIAPSQHEMKPAFGPIEIGLAVGAIGIAILLVLQSLGNAALIPPHEPVNLGEGHSIA
jgi:hypothetical protein